MIRKTKSIIPGHVRIVFELPSSVWADKVFLAGDFNDWRNDELQMRQERDGTWRIALDLLTGTRYEFRYLVDGQWQTDWHADGFENNGHGSQNSVVAAQLEDGTTVSVAPTAKANAVRDQLPQALSLAPVTSLRPLRGGYHIDERQLGSIRAA